MTIEYSGMRAADAWKDYELIDATEGFRLERWGDVILQRPDPQVIWQTPRQSPKWQQIHAVYHRSEKGGGHWQTNKELPNKWTINYKKLKLIVSPTGFKHTGVFPEQAVNWDVYTKLIKQANRPIKVLNLFGYTGGATLACLAAGASVTHVDASKGMLAWAKENAVLNGLDAKPVRWLMDDCLKFVAREIRRQNRYEGIIMDPPSYGRGPLGEVWKLEEAIWPLLCEAVQLLSDEAVFFTVNSYTTGFAPGTMCYMLQSLLKPKHGGTVCSGEIGLPVTESGGILPCGASAIWVK